MIIIGDDMITAILLGAGNRGEHAYGRFALENPGDIQFVGVAESNPVRRNRFSKHHNIPENKQFEHYQAILNQPKMADVCFICLQDTMHYEPTLKALELGYHVFLEKPMALTAQAVIDIYEQAKRYQKNVLVGHVLRYTPFFNAIKSVIDTGRIGEIMTIQHNENVSFWHQAHSYVRGNWRNTAVASPMILAKSCHDMDIMAWLVNSKPKQVASFGSLTHFKSKTMSDVPDYCLSGCRLKDTCPYYAPKVYINAPDWMKLPVSDDLSDEAILKALELGPYGRCVYRCDNDVVDHQVVSIEFENETTAAFTMTAFTENNTRTLKIMGTKGEIRGHMDLNAIEVHLFGQSEIQRIQLSDSQYGHGGGDYDIMKALVTLIEQKQIDIAGLEISVRGHLLAFMAEAARLKSKVIHYDEFIAGV